MFPHHSKRNVGTKKSYNHPRNNLKIFVVALATLYIVIHLRMATLTHTSSVPLDSKRKTTIYRNQNRFKVQSFASVRLRQMLGMVQNVNELLRNAPNVDDMKSAFNSIQESLIKTSKVDYMTSVSHVLERKITTIQGISNYSNVKSCFQYSTVDDNYDDSLFTFLNDDCQPSRATNMKKMVIYNPHEAQREWCGNKIPPLGVIILSVNDVATCITNRETHAAMYLLSPPSIFDPEEDKTILVVQDYGERTKDIECDVACRWPAKFVGHVKELEINGTNWKFIWSLEGPKYYGQIEINPDDYLRDQYYATTSYQSDIFTTYFSWDRYIKTEPIQFEKAIPGASFLARNCHSKNDRETWVKELQKYFRVDSLSTCLRNAKPPNGMSLKHKKDLMKQYLFYLAFENQNYDDYITEKLWESLRAGIVPVYLGAPNIKKHVPPGSIIVAEDFPSYEALGAYLTKVANDKTLYEQYHEWRKHDFPISFVKKYNFSHVTSRCRTCRWAYAKKYGLGWDHDNQSISDTTLMSTLCTDGYNEKGLVVHPFTEIWQSKENSTRQSNTKEVYTGIEKCDKCGLHREIYHDNYIVHRSFIQHDNVIDLVLNIESAQQGGLSPLFLRLETAIRTKAIHIPPLTNANERKNQNSTDQSGSHVFMQDDESRFTVLTDWTTRILSPQEGTVEILIYNGARNILPDEVFLRRIRIILEAQNKLHYNSDDSTPSYFANVASKEFRKPLEFFVLTS